MAARRSVHQQQAPPPTMQPMPTMIRPPMHPQQPPQPGPALPFLSFDMGSAPGAPLGPIPGTSGYVSGNAAFGPAAFENEPPLLEELGINPHEILQKTKSVLVPFRSRYLNLHQDADLSGPFVFCILFGLCQLLAGKLHFGVILGWGSLASCFLYLVIWLLSGRQGGLDLYRSFSLVGYSLLPMIVFSAVSLLIPRGRTSYALAALAVLWSTWSCSSLLVVLAPQTEQQKRLIGYACSIIYASFALLVLF